MQRYFLKFQYNGSNYHGSQIQPEAISVQEVLEEKISILLKEKIKLVFAGRTDAGVHAKEMWAHIDSENLDPNDKFIFRLNKFLPQDIFVEEIRKVKEDAHCRFLASDRTYEYHITTQKSIFNKNQFMVLRDLDLDKMNEACTLLFNHKDFEAFSRKHTDVNTFICTIKKAFWKQKNESEIVFTIQADRFLRNMVRAIVGTLILIGENKINLEDFNNIILSKNRSNAGSSVPAKGLFLTKVNYPKDTFIE